MRDFPGRISHCCAPCLFTLEKAGGHPRTLHSMRDFLQIYLNVIVPDVCTHIGGGKPTHTPHKNGAQQARKLGRCDSYLPYPKTLPTDPLTNSLTRVGASKNIGEVLLEKY